MWSKLRGFGIKGLGLLAAARGSGVSLFESRTLQGT